MSEQREYDELQFKDFTYRRIREQKPRKETGTFIDLCSGSDDDFIIVGENKKSSERKISKKRELPKRKAKKIKTKYSEAFVGISSEVSSESSQEDESEYLYVSEDKSPKKKHLKDDDDLGDYNPIEDDEEELEDDEEELEDEDSKGKDELDYDPIEDDELEEGDEEHLEELDDIEECEEVSLEESNKVENDAPRRSSRNKTETLREAFQYLRDGDIERFLDCWIIRRDLAPAFHLIEHEFNSGHNKELMMAMWKLRWAGNLSVVSLQNFRHRGRCIACNRKRKLKYCMFDLRGFLGIMGTDCYEVKFNPLMKLIDVCILLTTQLDREDFSEYAKVVLKPTLEAVREAPAIMKALYSKKGK